MCPSTILSVMQIYNTQNGLISAIGTEINEHGYSHLVMPHALWDVLHTEVDANGDVVPQVRPVALQRPPALLPTANPTQRAIWTTTDSKFTKETGYLVGMKRFILLGCGPAVTRLISQPGTGIRNLLCPDIIYQTGVLYGDASVPPLTSGLRHSLCHMHPRIPSQLCSARTMQLISN